MTAQCRQCLHIKTLNRFMGFDYPIKGFGSNSCTNGDKRNLRSDWRRLLAPGCPHHTRGKEGRRSLDRPRQSGCEKAHFFEAVRCQCYREKVACCQLCHVMYFKRCPQHCTNFILTLTWAFCRNQEYNFSYDVKWIVQDFWAWMIVIEFKRSVLK